MTTGARPPALTPHALDDVPAELTGGVVAIGNFDGIHHGHRVLLDRALDEARRLGVPAVVLTFEPHPRTVFKPDAPVFRLTPLAAKAHLFAALGFDGLVVATFDRQFATNSADAFVNDILVGQLKLKAVVVGFNFQFGKGRVGTPALLAAEGDKLGFAVTVLDKVADDGGAAVSSTAIRAALTEGDIATANRLLGYRWFVVGRIVTGDRRGRTLGFPTANLALGADCALRHGIYAVRLERADGEIHDGVANYGRRPTFGDGPPLLEVFVFDFSGDLYGEEVSVSFVEWIRPEARFDSAEALIAAMNEDAAKARLILANAGPGTALDRALAGAA